MLPKEFKPKGLFDLVRVGKDGIASCLEMTFSKNPELINNEVAFPHNLDQKIILMQMI